MIKAIIFDCFGVLVTSSYEPFKQKYFHGDAELIRKFIEIEDRSSRGEITLEQAEQGFAELAGISFEQCEYELAQNPRNESLLTYISESLKGNYKIGFLSNVAKDRTHELFTDADIALFDDMILSFQVGMAKPQPEIFSLAAERLGLLPNECVFVDDLSKYLVGADEAGMHTILFKDTEQFKQSLESLLTQDSEA
jgi:epoxide hydrolase-like predicted phosphatase